ncbi:hypothetical protein C5167_015617 [Papaver somniferum]|uniref:beta-glucosidase n=1 Tax=Papaver somniferum TaxID=3469 RepID=A0A4Y7J9N0_PAPSO|nr:hypothetical protein C5167_015617 [Papaver somniferum]
MNSGGRKGYLMHDEIEAMFFKERAILEAKYQKMKIVQEMTEIILSLQGDVPADSRKGVPYVGGNNKVAACAKHFVGDGGTTKGINEYNTVTDWHGLLSIHMPGYYNSIIKGVSTIMVSYSSWNSEKMHANRDLVTNFLKDTLNFRDYFTSRHQLYLLRPFWDNVGIDMIMIPMNHTDFIHDLTYLVGKNVIPMSRIDDAVKRILKVKFMMGEQPYAETTGDNLNLTIPEPGLSTMKNVCGSIKCVVVVMYGRPFVIEPYLSDVDALVAAWLPGSEGQGDDVKKGTGVHIATPYPAKKADTEEIQNREAGRRDFRVNNFNNHGRKFIASVAAELEIQ